MYHHPTEVRECCFPPTVGPSVTKSSPESSSLSSEMSRQRIRLKGGGGGGELEKIPLRESEEEVPTRER